MTDARKETHMRLVDKKRLVLAVSLAAATLALFLAVIAVGGALRAGLAPWPGIAAVVMATAAFALSGRQGWGSFLVAGLLATQFLAAAAFPPKGPIFGVILGLPLLGLGVAKGVATATATARAGRPGRR
jgi:hypothetical protein